MDTVDNFEEDRDFTIAADEDLKKPSQQIFDYPQNRVRRKRDRSNLLQLGNAEMEVTGAEL